MKFYSKRIKFFKFFMKKLTKKWKISKYSEKNSKWRYLNIRLGNQLSKVNGNEYGWLLRY